MVLYGLIKERNRKTYLVKNIATGERFHVDKEDFKQYEKEFKQKKNKLERYLICNKRRKFNGCKITR